MDIARLRLLNQRIARPTFETPGEVVAWLGAVQAQDYLGALRRYYEPSDQGAEKAIRERLENWRKQIRENSESKS